MVSYGVLVCSQAKTAFGRKMSNMNILRVGLHMSYYLLLAFYSYIYTVPGSSNGA